MEASDLTDLIQGAGGDEIIPSPDVCGEEEEEEEVGETNIVTLSVSTHPSSKEATVISTINLDTGQSEVQSDGLQNVIKSLESKIRRGLKRRIECDVCHEMFSQRFALKEHMRVHAGEKPYRCDVCDKSFRHVSNLQKHKMIHTGVKNFSCTVCGAKFRRKAHLENHRRKIHKDTSDVSGDLKSGLAEMANDRLYSCKKCNKTCRTMSSMRKHWAWQCYASPHGEGKQQQQSPVLKHFCSLCDKGYKYRCTLDLHLVAVHGEPLPMACEACGTGFGNLRELHTHRKLEHSETAEGQDSGSSKQESAPCVVPIYEIESKADLKHLDLAELEDECRVHAVPVSVMPSILMHRLWKHYKEKHADDMEKGQELSNLLINYGQTLVLNEIKDSEGGS